MLCFIHLTRLEWSEVAWARVTLFKAQKQLWWRHGAQGVLIVHCKICASFPHEKMMSCQGMSISFNVLCYLLNMQRVGGRRVYKLCWTLDLSFWPQCIMSAHGALRLACYQLLLLGVFGKHNNQGTRNTSPRAERSHRHHLPTYMMQLYRHFKLNQTQHLEHEHADTIKSILSKSKICFLLSLFIRTKVWERVARRGESLWSCFWLLAVKPQRQTPAIHIVQD